MKNQSFLAVRHATVIQRKVLKNSGCKMEPKWHERESRPWFLRRNFVLLLITLNATVDFSICPFTTIPKESIDEVLKEETAQLSQLGKTVFKEVLNDLSLLAHGIGSQSPVFCSQIFQWSACVELYEYSPCLTFPDTNSQILPSLVSYVGEECFVSKSCLALHSWPSRI